MHVAPMRPAWPLTSNTSTCRVAAFCLGVLAEALAPLSYLHAQETIKLDVDLDAGIAVTPASLTSVRGIGPLFRIALNSVETSSRVRYRVDAAWFSVSTTDSRKRPDGLQAVTLGYSGLFGPKHAKTFPYVLFGMGVIGLIRDAPDAYPGLLGVVNTGVGVRGTVGRARVHAEVAMARPLRALSHVFYWPVSVGVTF